MRGSHWGEDTSEEEAFPDLLIPVMVIQPLQGAIVFLTITYHFRMCKQLWSAQGRNSVIRMFVGTEHVEDVPNQDLFSPEL